MKEHEAQGLGPRSASGVVAGRVKAQVTLSLEGAEGIPAEELLPHLHLDLIVHCDDPRLPTMDTLVRDLTITLAPVDGGSAQDLDEEGFSEAGLPFGQAPSGQVFPAGRRLPHMPGRAESAAALEDGTADASAAQGQAASADSGPRIAGSAVIAMSSVSPKAEQIFRSVIVSLDAIPGNQVDGISPLYHVSNLDGPDAMSAVLQVSSHQAAPALAATLESIEMAHEGALSLHLVDMQGGEADTSPAHGGPCWQEARHRAAVLAPWLDMDPDARLGPDPVSYLLAMAPDADRVGLLSANWIIGETL
ncbi:hypothetical protein CRD60_07065 [Bifidobacterium aemilianum]|uniref:2-amino-4-hydroxy-6-hydroxymethyldihydropteridine pyrophosphokinase n=1 Tax=Bifidobacterium aemilianum TaxID=2493120 RepID=A0A366K890_9BIFI|nr:hypothetical protein [Bifidobacterium aemilianum]RBP97378.1 hypothetical protein CRD60_07065 [Bifidobacterium aemilianum]